jgi:hypothetical protein
MSEPEPASGQITFVESYVPSLEAGEYLISVEQQLHNSNPTGPDDTIDEQWVNTHRVAVRGERFTLTPGSIQGCFPPPNNRGEYAGVLAHLVLTSRTLPWQRSPDGGASAQPWLALLLFEASDPAPALQTIQVGDLQRDPFVRDPKTTTTSKSKLPASAVSCADGFAVLGESFAPDYGESLADPCQVIDVPVDLFGAIAPSMADLAWMAHARRVPVDAKPGSPPDRYAVLVGNRVPSGDGLCTVHLVSLEGLKAFLPADGSYTPATIKLPGGQPAALVRLVSLQSWSFTPTDAARSFEGYLTELDCGAFQRVDLGATSGPAGAVDAAFGLGYTALDHRTRHGDKTVSWYRGPFLPAADPDTAPLPLPAGAADELTHYDPGTGMLDVSYAAAWQLGRLLALQSGAYSVALNDWRRSAALKTAKAPSRSIAEVHADTQPPPEVARWLALLALLNGVPFDYLVADGGLLPAESIRFFELDEGWIDALLDGASSVGRATSTDLAHDAVLVPKLHAASRVRARELRPVLDAPTSAQQGISGFLLRSAAVSGWPGLEVRAYAAGAPTTPMPVLRMERLAPTILLVMVEGSISKLDIHEPAEALHFGVDPLKTKGLRYVTVPAGAPAGTQPGSSLGVSVPVRTRGQGVIELDALAAKLQTELALAHANNDSSDNPRPFTAAEFALQMVEAAQAVIFVNEPPPRR